MAGCCSWSTHAAACTGRFDAQNQRQDQRAKAMYANGDTYFGGYKADKREGMGLYTVAKGGAYAGSYSSSKRGGQGIMRMPDGGIYTGSFAQDTFDGQGQYEYPDGSVYVGAWAAGKKHGEVGLVLSVYLSICMHMF